MKDITNTQLHTEDIVKVLRELDAQICSGSVDFKDAQIKTTQEYEPGFYNPYNRREYSPTMNKARREIEVTVKVVTYG